MRVRPEVLAVEESPLVRIATAAGRVPGAIRLQYGESDTPTAELVCRAAYDAARAGHTFYTDPAGDPELRGAIAARFRHLQGMTRGAEHVTVTVGATQAIHLAIRALVGPGDNAVVIHPAYSIYTAAVTLCGGEARAVPLVEEGGRFRLDPALVERSLDARTRLLVVNSPSNPTGWVATPEELRALWNVVERHDDLVVMSDEVYERLVFEGDGVAPSIARFASDPDRVVVVNSFSKTYEMTGWRLGWAIASPPLIREMVKVQEFMTSSAPAMVQRAGLVALAEGEGYAREVRARYAARRLRVIEALSGVPGVSLPDPAGGFYAFPRVEGLTDSMSLALELLERTGVALAPGVAFGRGGEGHLRICFAVSEELLDQALGRIVAFLR